MYVRVFVYVMWTITFEPNDLWHKYLACWTSPYQFKGRGQKLKFYGQRSTQQLLEWPTVAWRQPKTNSMEKQMRI